MATTEPRGEAQQQKLEVRYDDLMARYANQVGLRMTPEEVYLEFSSGVIQDQARGTSFLPIHTRIAMTHAGVRRLSEILQQSLSRPQPAEGEAPERAGGDGRTSGSPPHRK